MINVPRSAAYKSTYFTKALAFNKNHLVLNVNWFVYYACAKKIYLERFFATKKSVPWVKDYVSTL
jgi:hypothetical protein